MNVNVRIQDKKDSDKGLFPEVATAGYQEGEMESVGILEGGMVSGKPSLSFNIKLSNGKYVIAQSSLEMLEAIVNAARGAQQRWNGQ